MYGIIVLQKHCQIDLTNNEIKKIFQENAKFGSNLPVRRIITFNSEILPTKEIVQLKHMYG